MLCPFSGSCLLAARGWISCFADVAVWFCSSKRANKGPPKQVKVSIGGFPHPNCDLHICLDLLVFSVQSVGKQLKNRHLAHWLSDMQKILC